MKLSVKITFFMVFLALQLHAQRYDYNGAWKKVHQLEIKGLHKSAHSSVEALYTKAQKDKNGVQKIKALLYLSKFTTLLEEESEIKVIDILKGEIKAAKSPDKEVLQNILANTYWQYFKANRWRFYNRTELEEQPEHSDFRYWDAATLFKTVQLHFQASFQNNKTTKKTPLENYNLILDQARNSKDRRPTLYDFLIHSALDFYKTPDSRMNHPQNQFTMDDPRYYELFFDGFDIAKDSFSTEYNALLLFQQIESHYTTTNNLEGLISTELERLKFVHQNAYRIRDNNKYLEALTNIQNKYPNESVTAEVVFEKANFLYQNAHIGSFVTGQNRIKALAICNTILEKYPESFGAEQSLVLKRKIESIQLNTEIEEIIPTNQHARVKLNYTGIDKIFNAIYPIGYSAQQQFLATEYDSVKLSLLQQIKPIKSWSTEMVGETDYFTHSTEIVLPPLTAGQYLLVQKVNATEPNAADLYTHTAFQVSDLALLYNENDGAYKHFQVINRNNGQPVAGVALSITSLDDNRPLETTITTDENGRTQPKLDYNYIRTKVVGLFQGDTINFSNQYLSKQYSGAKTDPMIVKPFLFSDRAIYRPGQEVHFKGILIQRQGIRSSVVPNEYVEVYLENVNGEEIGNMRLKSNAYGSFSGKFVLPTSGLTGRFSLHVEEDNEQNSAFYDQEMDSFYSNSLSFVVEEYKRPKFEVVITPTTQTFALNDTVSVKGVATAYAGSAISQANVVYKVFRKVRYPDWYYWHRRYYRESEGMEITHGTTKTDDKGGYVIDFAALPDLSVDKTEQPIFEYQVSVDVTDINGETRSATTVVKIGYHTMTAQIETAAEWAVEQRKQTIAIHLKNLNGQPVEGKGKIKIFKKTGNSEVKRNRPWEAPSHPVLDSATFNKLFPNDYYGTETEAVHKELVWASNFNSLDGTELQANIKTWAPGDYEIEFATTDSIGNLVEAKSKLKITDSKSTKPSSKHIFQISTNQTLYQPGDKAVISLSTALPDLYVTIAFKQKHKIVRREIIHLQNEKKNIAFSLSNTDYPGVAVFYHLSGLNRFESGSKVLQVALPEKKLSIETITFRDKIQPGKKESWKFKLKGASKDAVMGEILASMYDASLDQFTPHQWQYNFTPRDYYYAHNTVRSNGSFGKNHGRTVNSRFFNGPIPVFKYDQLNWFGFNLAGGRYSQRYYLNQIKLDASYPKITKQVNTKVKKGQVQGYITDQDGTPLQEVSIQITGNKRNYQVNDNGYFSIKVDRKDTLQFSRSGYVTIKYVVEEHSFLDVNMVLESNVLEEVLITAQDYFKSKNNLANSVSRTSRKELSLDLEVEEDVDLAFSVLEEENVALEGKVAGIAAEAAPGTADKTIIRGNSSLGANKNILYVVDGEIVDNFELEKEAIHSIKVLKGTEAVTLYGVKAANGVIIIQTKKAQAALNQLLASVKARSDFKETAFFFPHIQSDPAGNFEFSFETPESLTQWKLQLLGHTKSIYAGYTQLSTVTQKNLMVIPNVPRFLREGDGIVISTKISNLLGQPLNGNAALLLTDPITGASLDVKFEINSSPQEFNVQAKGNTEVQWKLQVPQGVDAVQYKIVAVAGNHSDGEQNYLPVLKNTALVTEALPIFLSGSGSKKYNFVNLQNTQSTTLQHQGLSLEFTGNPIWNVIKSMPYLMEFPHECSEQTFARYYSNVLVHHIQNKHPEITKLIEGWAASGQLISPLEKNEAFKSMLIQETPWLRNAQSETEKQQLLASLFDMDRVAEQRANSAEKLLAMQLPDGGFPWFKGSGRSNRYITLHIVATYNRLKKLGVYAENDSELEGAVHKALGYLDNELVGQYQKLLKQVEQYKKNSKDKNEAKQRAVEFMNAVHLSESIIEHLTLIQDYNRNKKDSVFLEALAYYEEQGQTKWMDLSLSSKAKLGLYFDSKGKDATAQAIMNALYENSITNEEMGMYWKENQSGYGWYQSKVEVQADLLRAFMKVKIKSISTSEQQNCTNNMVLWLMRQKQSNQWNTTKATTAAISAILEQDLKISDGPITINLGKEEVELNASNAQEKGLNYIQKTWDKSEVNASMGSIEIKKTGEGVAWGAVYWQYFEQLDKIKASTSALQIHKSFYVVKNTTSGEKLIPIDTKNPVALGDKIRVRIQIKTDRDMEFIHLKDMRAAGFEPIDVLSVYKWQDALGYYQSTKDASTHFFFDIIRKGNYVLEYDLRANNSGDFSNGISNIESMYAPEFRSQSAGERVIIK